MTHSDLNEITGRIATAQVSDVADLLRAVTRLLEGRTYLTREDVGEIREALTKALAQINAVERLVVGVPKPKFGD